MKQNEKSKAEVSKLMENSVILEDFDQDWDEIKPFLLSDPKMSCHKTKDRNQHQNLDYYFYSRQPNVIQEVLTKISNLQEKRLNDNQSFDFHQALNQFQKDFQNLATLNIHALSEKYTAQNKDYDYKKIIVDSCSIQSVGEIAFIMKQLIYKKIWQIYLMNHKSKIELM